MWDYISAPYCNLSFCSCRERQNIFDVSTLNLTHVRKLWRQLDLAQCRNCGWPILGQIFFPEHSVAGIRGVADSCVHAGLRVGLGPLGRVARGFWRSPSVRCPRGTLRGPKGDSEIPNLDFCPRRRFEHCVSLQTGL